MKQHSFLATLGSETAVIGFYMAIQTAFKDDPHQVLVHAAYQLGGSYWALVMIVTGIFAMIIGLLDWPKPRWLNAGALSLLSGVWLVYAMAFVIQDIDFGHLGMITIFAVYVFILIIVQSLGGDRRE